MTSAGAFWRLFSLRMRDFLRRKRDFRRGTIVPCLASTRLVQFIKTVNGWVFLIEPLGHKYMEEVSSDDIKLAMVNVSSKSCSVYRSVQMLYKCIFILQSKAKSSILAPVKFFLPKEESHRRNERHLQTNRLTNFSPPSRGFLYVFVMIGLYAGLRREEILALK